MTKAQTTGRVLRDTSKDKPASEWITEWDGRSLREDFKAKDMVLLHKGRDPLVAYTGEYKGKQNFHIRTIYADANDEWCPGKGVSVPLEAKDAVIAALAGKH